MTQAGPAAGDAIRRPTLPAQGDPLAAKFGLCRPIDSQ